VCRSDLKLELLIGRDEIGRRVKELAEEISRDYESPLMLGILNGAFIFMADLVREMKIPVEIEFVRVKSYRGVNTTGKVEILMDVSDVKDKDVLIVEDIVDTGITMNFLVKRVMKRGASSVKVCTLLDKPSRRIVDVIPDYVGFTIPDYFVVGYGLDYNGMYRELPEIYRICD
jgi:hypoxanthine phosphoribosyltransferase